MHLFAVSMLVLVQAIISRDEKQGCMCVEWEVGRWSRNGCSDLSFYREKIGNWDKRRISYFLTISRVNTQYVQRLTSARNAFRVGDHWGSQALTVLPTSLLGTLSRHVRSYVSFWSSATPHRLLRCLHTVAINKRKIDNTLFPNWSTVASPLNTSAVWFVSYAVVFNTWFSRPNLSRHAEEHKQIKAEFQITPLQLTRIQYRACSNK